MGRKGSSGMGGGGASIAANQTSQVRSDVKSRITNNSKHRMEYTETASGSTWAVSGAPKGDTRFRGRAGVELRPSADGTGFTLTQWTMGGDKLPNKEYRTLGRAMNAATSYLDGGFRKASR